MRLCTENIADYEGEGLLFEARHSAFELEYAGGKCAQCKVAIVAGALKLSAGGDK